jgi:hypothetical protein
MMLRSAWPSVWHSRERKEKFDFIARFSAENPIRSCGLPFVLRSHTAISHRINDRGRLGMAPGTLHKPTSRLRFPIPLFGSIGI